MHEQPFPVLRLFLNRNGEFPNNEAYPLVIYKKVFDGNSDFDGQDLLVSNGWTSPWAWGVFEFHHYVSNFRARPLRAAFAYAHYFTKLLLVSAKSTPWRGKHCCALKAERMFNLEERAGLLSRLRSEIF
jgi:hypothetical protein